MTEELKLIAEIFKSATDGALHAYLGFIGYSLVRLCVIVYAIVSTIKYVVNRVFIVVNRILINGDSFGTVLEQYHWRIEKEGEENVNT